MEIFTFLHILSLQMALIIFETVGITLMFITGIINAYTPNNSEPDPKMVQRVLTYLTATTLIFGHVSGFFGTFWQHIDLLLLCAELLTGGLMVWGTLTIGSYMHLFKKKFTAYKWVCMEGSRCPDVLWIFDGRWRHTGYDCPPEEIPRVWPVMSYSAEDQLTVDNNITSDFLLNITEITNNVTLWQKDITSDYFPGCDVGKGGLIFYSMLLAISFLVFEIVCIVICLKYRTDLIERYKDVEE